MKNVVMLLDNAFEPDIRVYKEAKYLVDKGIDIEIVCLDKKNKYKDKEIDNYDGIKIKRIFCRTDKLTKLIEKHTIVKKLKMIIYFWWLIKFIVQAKKYLKNKDFEILHCHDLTMAFVGCTFFRKKQIIFDMHEYYGDSRNKIKNYFIRKAVSYTQNRAKWIIYVNEFQLERCKEKNKNKCIHIPNYPSKETFQTIEKTKNDKVRVGYIGKVRDFSSLSKLIDCDIDTGLMEISIYGNGSALEQLIEHAKRQKKEYILKGIYNGIDETERIYQNTDVLYAVYDVKCNNNLNWKNSMPVKSYEAIFTATPIIATKDTTLGEFVEEHNIGFTVNVEKNEIAEVLKNILNNRGILKEKQENIKKIQYIYTWENIIKNIDEIYCTK